MEDFNFDFNNFKISALSKSKQINSFVKNTTIGPNRTILEDDNSYSIPIDTSVVMTKPKDSVYKVASSTVIINRLIADIENDRQKKVKDIMSAHVNRFMEFSKKQQLESYQHLQRKQACVLNERNQQELLILKALEEHDKDASAKQHQLSQYYEELAQRKKKIDQELREYEKRKQLLTAIIDKIKTNQIEFRCAYQDVIINLQGCMYPKELKNILDDIPMKLQSLPNDMELIINKCKAGKVKEIDSIKSGHLVKDIQDVLELLKQKIAEVNQQQQQQQTQTEEVSKPKVVIKHSQEPVTATTVDVTSTQIDKFISKSSLRTYSQLQNFLENFTNSYNELLNDDNFKQFKFNCKKAINIPVNAVSAVNSQHLLDKYNKLLYLLQGKMVDVGDTQVSAIKHPQGIAFCTNLLAKKFILQGDLMISSKPDAAFCYAAIISALWYENEDFGKLLLAHFHMQCPYLVPLYPPHTIGQNDKEYYLSLGYQYTDDVIEKQDKFLKRMTGIMRLYSAIIIAKPKRGQQRNLHGITEGWRWLSSFLNLEPKPDITATLLHVFFEIAGSTMEMVYGKVFRKLMHFVCGTYFPMIQKIDKGGPVTRLEVLLQEYMKLGCFKEPPGVLADNFW